MRTTSRKRATGGAKHPTGVFSVACSLMVLLVTVGLGVWTGTGSAQAAGSTPACGKGVLYKPNGIAWHCTFDDEFSKHSLDTTKWTAMDTATTAFDAGIECDSPNNVNTNGHDLVLSATRHRTALPCGREPDNRYRSGMVTTLNTFSQTYGRFEVRAKLPKGIGMHPAFWMLPVNPSHSNSYEYGEMDVFEAYADYPDMASPHLHYVTTPGQPLGGVNCTLDSAISDWHTYAVQWTSTQMSFIYDGTTCWTTSWQPLPPYAPSGSNSPVPFDQPFYILLALAVDGTDANNGKNAVQANTKFPEKMLVDYVRAWS
ncbi:MAG TPA: glycoside hydrolase family 16 protein [Jatrophihabitantaceae bacterium]|jgi:beta-glucanase (GH16 family)